MLRPRIPLLKFPLLVTVSCLALASTGCQTGTNLTTPAVSTTAASASEGQYAGLSNPGLTSGGVLHSVLAHSFRPDLAAKFWQLELGKSTVNDYKALDNSSCGGPPAFPVGTNAYVKTVPLLVQVDQGVAWQGYVDSTPVMAGVGPGLFEYNGPPLAEGMHTATAEGDKGSGPYPLLLNYKTFSTYALSFGIDDDAPAIGSVSSTWNSPSGASGLYQLTVTGTLADVGVAGLDPTSVNCSAASQAGLVTQSSSFKPCTGPSASGTFTYQAAFSKLPSEVMLDITAADYAGNQSTLSETIAGPTHIVLTPPSSVFSPNGDGVKDTDSLTVTSSEPWTLSVDGQGNIQTGAPTGDAGLSVTWDGTVNGTKLQDGSYTLRLHADGAQDQTANVTIDTQAPKISGATLQAVSTDPAGATTIQGTASIADLGLAGVEPSSINVTLNGYLVSNTSFTTGADGSSVTYQATITSPMLANLTGAPQACHSTKTGYAYLQILACDKAGNRSVADIKYQITFPPLDNRGMVHSGRSAYAILSLSNGPADELSVEQVEALEFNGYAQDPAEREFQLEAKEASGGLQACGATQAGAIVVDGITLQDGMTVSVNEALTLAEDFVGPGYTETSNGRFVSADGTRVVRMGDSDILGKHGGGSHMNFEVLEPNPAKLGKMRVV